MICYKVTHRHKLSGHFEYKDIGVYSSMANAEAAIEHLKSKKGFSESINGFKIKKVLKIFKPKLLDKTFWIDGFVTYTY